MQRMPVAVVLHLGHLGLRRERLADVVTLALALGYPRSIWPWLYPLYYLVLLVPRQLDDDRRCAEKYGPMWNDYKRAVPYRIVPFVY